MITTFSFEDLGVWNKVIGFLEAVIPEIVSFEMSRKHYLLIEKLGLDEKFSEIKSPRKEITKNVLFSH